MTNVNTNFYYVFILILYMFRAQCARITSDLHTTRSPIQSDIPEVVLIQFVSPDDEHNVLETCRELK
jgi:hypothetical protein